MTIKTILCPVDLSPASGAVLRTALAIARREKARTTVLHVLEPLLAQASALAVERDMLRRLALGELLGLIRQGVADLGRPGVIMPDIRCGEPEEAILEAIEGELPDLVVGTHGFGGLKRLFFGSTAARVLARATRPILTVPSQGLAPDQPPLGTAPFGLQCIVVPVNFTQAALGAIDPAVELARHWSLPLVLVHAAEHAPHVQHWSHILSDERAQRMDRTRGELELLAGEITSVPVRVVHVAGTPEHALADFVAKEPGSLIALGIRADGKSRPVFPLGSTAYRLLCLTHRPVLVLPAQLPREPHVAEHTSATTDVVEVNDTP